jgi:hypothetical protein
MRLWLFRCVVENLFLVECATASVGKKYLLFEGTYRIILGGNSHYSNTIFRLQKRTIRVIVGLRSRDSRREHFKKLKILPLQSQYILSLLLFVVGNRSYFKENSDIHNINTRTKSNLHQPLANSSTYQKEHITTGLRCSIAYLHK